MHGDRFPAVGDCVEPHRRLTREPCPVLGWVSKLVAEQPISGLKQEYPTVIVTRITQQAARISIVAPPSSAPASPDGRHEGNPPKTCPVALPGRRPSTTSPERPDSP